MKKVIAFALLSLGLNTFAQENPEKKDRFTPEQKTEFAVKKMTKDLDLNEKQQEEIRALLKEEALKRSEKKAEFKDRKENNNTLSEEEKQEMKEKGKENRAEFNKKMAKILSPDQMKKWEESKKERAEKISKKPKYRKENQ